MMRHAMMICVRGRWPGTDCTLAAQAPASRSGGAALMRWGMQ